MTSGGGQDWRGGRAPRNSGRQEDAAPSWKQSRHSPGAHVRLKGFWPKLRIGLAVLLLIALVATVIATMDPAEQYRTHFVVLNLMDRSRNFDAAAALTLPERIEQESTTRVVTQCHPDTLALVSTGKSDKQNLEKADTVIVVLQTSFVPAPNGEFWCLIGNSTPNLDDPSQFAVLGSLKSQLESLWKSDPDKNVLLLVDTPPTNFEWRTGCLHASLIEKFKRWTEEHKRLVVMIGSPSNGTSEPGIAGSAGESVFSHFASVGLSTLANENPGPELTTTEYCRYVAEQTDSWVREHRNVAGQAVTVLPAIDALSKERPDFNVVTDLIRREPTQEALVSESPVDLSAIGTLWSRRESLQMRGGKLWNPLLWRSASDELLRAENASLHGQNAAALRALNGATATLDALEELTNRMCPQSELKPAGRGKAISEFLGLPSLGRVSPLLEAEATGAVSTPEHASSEDVIVSQLNEFPFTSVGLSAPSNVEAIRSRRANVESAIAQLLGSADQLAQTVQRLEETLLLTEDRQFTRPNSADRKSPDDADPDPLIIAIAEFSDLYDRAQATLSGVLDDAPSLACWASETGRESSDADRKIWQKVLAQNSPDRSFNSGDLNSMFDPLKGLGNGESAQLTEHHRAAVELRMEIFRFMVYGRVVQQSLLINEPNQGFSADELQAVNGQLRAAQKNASRSQQRVSELIETMCGHALSEKPARRSGQVDAYHFLRSTLNLTTMKAATRISVLQALRTWDEKFATSESDTEAGDRQASEFNLTQSFTVDEALWMLQVINLIPSTAKQSELLSNAWNSSNSLASGSADDEHEALARFGEMIRRIWQENHENVDVAFKDTTSNAHRLLRTADQQARLFSGFDAETKSLHSLSNRLRQFHRFQYCLMYADRLLSGLWIEPQDTAPYVQNGWYAKAARGWLTIADECRQSLANDLPGAPAFVAEAIQQREMRLLQSEQLALTFNTGQSDLNLGEQSKASGTVAGTVTMTGCANIAGEATVLVRIDPNVPVGVENNAAAFRIGNEAVKSPLEVRRRGDPGTSGCHSVSITPETFFRGRFRKSERQILIDPCEPAKFVIEKNARSKTASINVSGSDPRPVVLILDYSESMLDPLTTRPDTQRYEEALATLEDLVKNGALNGSRVILNVYGHRVTYKANVNKMLDNPLYAKCFEKLIPGGMNAQDDIATEFDATIGKPAVLAEFNKVIRSLRCSKPWGITPLLTAITNALDADLKDKAGIVIAVTDGEATDLNDPKQKALQKALKNNEASSVNIVAFDVEADSDARKKLQATFQPFKIEITDAAQRNQLLNKIFALLDPRSYTITWDNGEKSKTAELGSPVAELTASEGMEFTVKFSDIGTGQPILLRPADALQLDISHVRKCFLFKRQQSSNGKEAIGGEFSNDSPTMLMSIAKAHLADLPPGQNSESARAELSLMLDHPRDDLPVRQPAEIEFAVRPASSTSTFRPAMIHQEFTSRFGAPGWNLTIDEWPKEQRFLVDAIWKMNRTPPNHVVRWNELRDFVSIDSAMPVHVDGLPEFQAWVTLRGNDLQVRLDPAAIVPHADRPLPLGEELAQNRVEDIRIEVGKKDTSDQNQTFQPWEIDTRVVRLASGSVRYEFSGEQISPENLADAQIAFTAATARKTGSTEIRDFLID